MKNPTEVPKVSAQEVGAAAAAGTGVPNALQGSTLRQSPCPQVLSYPEAMGLV